MNRAFIASAFALLLVALPTTAAGQEEKEGITVHGIGEIERPADYAQITFEVRGLGRSFRDAVAAAGKTVDSVTSEFIRLGVKKEDLQTSRLNVGKNYRDRSFLSSRKDYAAEMTVMVKVRNLDLLDPVIFTISENEVEMIQDIDFALEDKPKIVAQALRDAAANARNKAEIMAAELGAAAGNVLWIEEAGPAVSRRDSGIVAGTRESRRLSMEEFAEADVAVTSGVLPEMIKVRAAVVVRFALEAKPGD